jgi:polyisoprenoid-binding protein YceI
MTRIVATAALTAPFAFAAALVAAAPAAAVEYNQVLPERSAIAFTSKQMGVPVDGRFRRFSAAMNFDPAKLATASARIDIDLASIDAGSKDADDEVVGKQWFNTKAFPTASFVSSGVRALGGDRYEALGKISIKGRTQDAALPFTFKPEGGNAVFDGNLTLKRLDFAIGEGPWSDVGTVANEVQVKFRIVAASKK